MGNIWNVPVVLFSLKLSAVALEQTRSPYLPKNVRATLYKKRKVSGPYSIRYIFPLCHSREKLSAKEELMYEEFESHYKRGRG